MSKKYTVKQFMCDFIALWKNPELERLKISPDTLPIRAFFQQQYGENAESFGTLHMKVMRVFTNYVENHRPGLIEKIERAPNSLPMAIFFLVSERGIDDPSREQIEQAEAIQTPQN